MEAAAFAVRQNLETMREAGATVAPPCAAAAAGQAGALWPRIVSDVTGAGAGRARGSVARGRRRRAARGRCCRRRGDARRQSGRSRRCAWSPTRTTAAPLRQTVRRGSAELAVGHASRRSRARGLAARRLAWHDVAGDQIRTGESPSETIGRGPYVDASAVRDRKARGRAPARRRSGDRPRPLRRRGHGARRRRPARSRSLVQLVLLAVVCRRRVGGAAREACGAPRVDRRRRRGGDRGRRRSRWPAAKEHLSLAAGPPGAPWRWRCCSPATRSPATSAPSSGRPPRVRPPPRHGERRADHEPEVGGRQGRRFHLADECRARGIEPIVLQPATTCSNWPRRHRAGRGCHRHGRRRRLPGPRRHRCLGARHPASSASPGDAEPLRPRSRTRPGRCRRRPRRVRRARGAPH